MFFISISNTILHAIGIGWILQGINSYSYQNFLDAIHCFEEAEEFKDDDELLYYCKAKSLERIGNFPEAINNYNKALSLVPHYKAALTFRNRLRQRYPVKKY